MEDILKLIGFAAAFGLVGVAMWQITFAWRDPREETDAEKRRREKREKKEASKPKQVEELSRQGKRTPSTAYRRYFNSLRRWR